MTGLALRSALKDRGQLAFIGVYDVFSATVAQRHFDGIFLSGFSFAASHYGLPDIGFKTRYGCLSTSQKRSGLGDI